MPLQDLRFALRQLGKNPGFAALAVITLALGIAANGTIFSWINSTLLNPIPGATQTGEMVTLMQGDRSEHPTPPFSYPDYVDLRDSARSFSGMLAYNDNYVTITGPGRPLRLYAALTTANYFEVLGVRPVLGQTLSSTAANERQGAPIAVLGYDLWQNHFAADPAIVGKTVEVNVHSYTIAGVAPKGFHGAKSGLRAEMFIPLGMNRQVWGYDPMENRGLSCLQVLGVLRKGVDRREAENELNVLMQRIVDRYPDSHRGSNQMSTDPLWRSPFGANVYFAGTLPILLALAGVLLLLACANVANLLLVRSVGRRREFAIRMSMGASRWRLVSQLMIENLLIGLMGGALALICTWWTAQTLPAFLPITTLPIALDGKVDGTVLLATIAVSILTAVLSGIVPALRASHLSPVAVLKDEALSTSGGLQKSRLAGGLVVTQIALSLLLLSCAGLFIRSLQKAQEADPGFDPNHVFLATYDMSPLGLKGDARTAFHRHLLERLKELPGVQSATLADFSPLSWTIHSGGAVPEGYVPRPHESISVDDGDVTPGYLETLRTPLLAGRGFTAQDDLNHPLVVLVNKAYADRYWPGQDALGKRINWGGDWYTVVGVTGNGKYRRLVYDAAPLVLFPMFQRVDDLVTIHVRTAGDPQAVANEVEQTVHGLNADLPLFDETTLKQSIQAGSVFERLAVALAGSFGLLAMVLAAIGVYGVIAYVTKQRTHEIGIRMALGAGRGDVFRQVLGQGLRLTLAGLAIGLAVSLVLTRFLRGMLFGVGTADWLTFATVAGVLCLVALVACFVPARRAASVDPMQALRTE